MKTILTSVFLLAAGALFAQAPAAKTTTTTVATAQQGPVLSDKAKALCKEWQLSKVELFSDARDPEAQQKNDRLILMQDGRYRLIYDGVAEGGTWTVDKANTWITLTTDAGAVKKFKILESTDTTLKIDYKDADDVHNVLVYTAGPAQKR